MTSLTRHRHRYRCSSCSRRFAKPRAPHLYVRTVKCPYCKSDRTRSIEAERRKQVRKQDTCRCASIPYPHRRRSLRMCQWNYQVLAGHEVSQADADAHDRMMRTARLEPMSGSDAPAHDEPPF